MRFRATDTVLLCAGSKMQDFSPPAQTPTTTRWQQQPRPTDCKKDGRPNVDGIERENDRWRQGAALSASCTCACVAALLLILAFIYVRGFVTPTDFDALLPATTKQEQLPTREDNVTTFDDV